MSSTEHTDKSVATSNRPRLVWVIAALIVLVGGGVFADYWSARPEGITAEFVGRDTCAKCHQSETESFLGSDHDKAMDLATDETVLGDFEDVTFEHDGLVNRLYREGSRFMVHTEGEDGRMQDFEVKYVFGHYPLQQYMVEFDRQSDVDDCEIARLQVLRISWDSHKGEWFYLRPPDVTDKLAADDPLHWTGIAQRWQTMCADCHSTGLKENFDTKTATYHTTYSEIDVSCEACHGPGSLHVELAEDRSLFWDRRYGYGLTKLKGEDPEPQIQTCAPCHSRRGVMDHTVTTGAQFCDHYRLESLGEATYHGDGQIKDEVYVYGSFIQSKMYHKGIRCTDCHDPHSLKLKHPGNETCTSCHQHSAGKYDVPSHHHHTPGTPGAMCVNCHMPETTYMEVDPRRDHSLRVPRPDLSVKLGTPNACSQCHVRDRLEEMTEDAKAVYNNREYAVWLAASDESNPTAIEDGPVGRDGESLTDLIQKTDQWCDDACEKWYGAQRKKPEHFAETLVPLRNGDPDAIRKAIALLAVRDERAPAIARATLLEELARRPFRKLPDVAKQVATDSDEHPMVRAAAATTMADARPNAVKSTLLKLLNDPSRLVRTSAARTLVFSASFAELTGSERTQLDSALREVKEELQQTPDRAASHMNWGTISEQLGNFGEAIQAYQTAIRVEPNSTGPRSHLATLLERLAPQVAPAEAQKFTERVKTLRKDELPLLGRDARLAPNIASVQYRYGLSLYLDGQNEKALQYLEKAAVLEPENEDFRLAIRLLKEKLAEE